MFSKGIRAFVSVRELSNGFAYTIARMSPFIPFPIPELYDEFNRAENISLDQEDRWGGSDIIGGSPRARGSKLNPQDLEKIINEFLSKKPKL